MVERADATRLIVFTRCPQPGTTKTRLIPVLGAEGAAELHEFMTRHMLGWSLDLVRQTGIDLEVRFAGGDEETMHRLFGGQIRCERQCEGDLGQRLEHACGQAFSQGMQRVLIAGTDCPALTSGAMRSALEALEAHDLAILPATDGGYVLLGLRKPAPELFRGPEWGSERVFRQTLAIAAECGLSVWSGPALPDVDVPADLPVWDRFRREMAPPVQSLRPEVSVIVPVLNEVERLPLLLRDLRRQRHVSMEIQVVDGGSTDGTIEKVRASGLPCLRHASGRGSQMNRGAAETRSPYLMFLHADSRLSDDRQIRRAVDALQTAILQEGSDRIAGHFPLKFEETGDRHRAVYRGLERKTTLNRPGSVLGDQGLLVSADYFRWLGGFDESLPWLEDLRIAKKIESSGRWLLLPGPLGTSARRFESEGFWPRYLLSGLMIALHETGHIESLKQWPGLYRPQRETRRLDLWPFVRELNAMMRRQGIGWSLQQWAAIGRFLRGHLWQMWFWLDCLTEDRPDRTPFLDRYDRWFSAAPAENRPVTDRWIGWMALAAWMSVLTPAVWLDRHVRNDESFLEKT